MRRIFLLFSAAILGFGANAQVEGGGEDFQKLFDWFVLEKYEDCLFKATTMSEKEKYQKAPEPWLYMSMCLLKIAESNDDELTEKYPKALANSLKYAAKGRKKDKSGELFEQNIEFFDEIKKLGCADAHGYLNEGNHKKAASLYKKVLKVDKTDYAIQYMTGVCYAYAKNIGEAKLNLKTATDSLKAKFTRNPDYKLRKVSEPVLSEATIMYSDYLVEKGMSDSAKTVIQDALSYLPEDKDLKMQADKLGVN